MNLVGRHRQVEHMNDALTSSRSSFIAVTGRRRIGKTYLIDQMLSEYMCLRVTGIQDVGQEEQIVNFTQKLAEASNFPIVTIPENWQQVFLLLKAYLKQLPNNQKQVIFIDELPWMATAKSGFIQLLAHLWNDYLSKENHFILVICGSSTSWIDAKVIRDKGGFHNRVTHPIRLHPFTLAETKEFLESRKINLSDKAIIQLYMAVGGVPYYLEQFRRGESVSSGLQRMCFDKEGILYGEYNNLYRALFKYPDNHEAVIKTLAESPQGLTRHQLIDQSGVSAGGPYTRVMEDLLASGFVEEVIPYGRQKRGSIYRLIDEYSLFYHKFIKKAPRKASNYWQEVADSPSHKIWSGYAFENLCIKHIDKIKEALGIAGVATTVSGFSHKGTKDEKAFQIDIVIDRGDEVINLCECKFYNEPIAITKKLANELDYKRAQFRTSTKTKKTLFNTLITTYPVSKNEYALESIDKVITMDQLF